MTDKELLELSAKAAGYTIKKWDKPDCYTHRYGEVAYVKGWKVFGMSVMTKITFRLIWNLIRHPMTAFFIGYLLATMMWRSQ